jgi:hypothetical protein
LAKLKTSPVARILLAGLVDVIPEYTEIEPYRDKNFNLWRSNGAYVLEHCDNKSFKLKVTQREYGAILFSEGQHLLNHAAENRAHLLNLLGTGKDPSPSWTIVTLYYFSLFIAMAWTRASNAAILYLDKDSITQFCSGGSPIPAGGTYEAIASLDSKTGASYVELKKCKASRFHEAIWTTIHNQTKHLASEIEKMSSCRTPAADELLALRSLRLFDGLKFDTPSFWQSKLRNGINYRPGFSYRSVVKNNFLKNSSRLLRPPQVDLEGIISYGEHAKSKVLGISDPFEAANDCVDLLIAQTLLLEAFTYETFSQLCEDHDLSCSAFIQRKSFAKQNTPVSSIITALIY